MKVVKYWNIYYFCFCHLWQGDHTHHRTYGLTLQEILFLLQKMVLSKINKNIMQFIITSSLNDNFNSSSFNNYLSHLNVDLLICFHEIKENILLMQQNF